MRCKLWLTTVSLFRRYDHTKPEWAKWCQSPSAGRHQKMTLQWIDVLLAKHQFIAGSFFDDDLPKGFDIISLIRVLYDHSDETVKQLLTKVYTALPKNGRLSVSEPMLGHRNPNRFGDTYFAIYTMAMNTGKTRSPSEICDILKQVGFSQIKINASPRPFVTTVIEAFKK